MSETSSRPSPAAASRALPSTDELLALIKTLRAQCREGWDIQIMRELHHDIGLLAGAASHQGQLTVGEQLLALETALTPAVTRKRTPDAGATALIAALAEHLETIIPRAEPQPLPRAAELPPTSAANGNLLVLVACMQPELNARVAAVLGGNGFTVRQVAEPLAALEELSRFAPDCILTDLNTPAGDGVELAEMIHERSDFADVPVIFLAGAGESLTRTDVLAADFSPLALAASIRERVGERLIRNDIKTRFADPRRQYRRAWLFDRLNATLTTGNPRGGLLDIAIDEVTTLNRDHGMATLIEMHEQLGRLIGELFIAGDMLAENGAGFVLLSRERSRENMYALAEDIRKLVAGERFGPAALPLSITIGGCILDASLDAVDAVVSAAQRARVSALPGHVGWHHHGRGALDPLQLETALRKGRLHLVFQAIVHTSGAPLPQYQALLRLRDTDGYVHTAGELLPVARRGGLTPTLDRWSLDRGLALLAEYQRQTRPLRLFISQSRESLSERNFPAWLAARLKSHGVRSARLVLDFHFDDIAAAPQDILRAAPGLKALGVGLCLSGVDRSPQAMQLIDLLPLDHLRLAPGICHHPGALLAVAHGRSMAVIAPQVEDAGMLRDLRRMGVDCVQGNSLAHPGRALNYAFENAIAG